MRATSTTTTMKAVYARVSTEEQARSGYSLDDQILQCKRKAGTDDVLVYVDDGVSGEYLDRPQLNKLLDDVENGLIDKVVCLSPDRLSRNSRKAEELLYRLSRRGVSGRVR